VSKKGHTKRGRREEANAALMKTLPPWVDLGGFSTNRGEPDPEPRDSYTNTIYNAKGRGP